MENNLDKRKILTYDDLMVVEPGVSDEQVVDICKYDSSIIAEYIKQDMVAYTGDIIYVRDTLARKLSNVNAKLAQLGLKLKVEYGYRHPEVQERYFFTRRKVIQEKYPNYSDEEIDKITHNFVAVPSVAGHPAGAAVDLTIVTNDGEEVDMGTQIANYSDPEKIITDSENLTLDQVHNRKLLHDLMVSEGFAPFYGEWWHFSYGDREWAAFYNKKALYGAINFQVN